MATETVPAKVAEAAASNSALTDHVIYLMGISFVVGALFAIFLMVLLDFMKRDRVPREPD